MAPYVSARRLVENSISGMLAAIELYNKPRVTYRDEITVILLVNAWELALKAVLRKHRVSIFDKKKRGEPYRSIPLNDAIGKIAARDLWPLHIDGVAVATNVKALATYRDRAIHLYNAKGLSALVYPFLQQNILNYRDLMVAKFNKDLADSITWQLLPLGVTVPGDAIQFMKADAAASAAAEAKQFIDDLKKYIADAEAAGCDLGRVATYYDVNLKSVKQMSSSDLTVAVSSNADGQVVIKKIDPNDTHPFSMAELLERANAKRVGRKLTTYDHQAICWEHDLRNNKLYAWRHGRSVSYGWSPEAVAFFAQLPYEECARIRKEFNKAKRKSGSSKDGT